APDHALELLCHLSFSAAISIPRACRVRLRSYVRRRGGTSFVDGPATVSFGACVTPLRAASSEQRHVRRRSLRQPIVEGQWRSTCRSGRRTPSPSKRAP